MKAGKKISSILISLGFVFNLLIFAPLEFYFLNIYDFWFPIKFILPIIIIVSIICFIILFFILQKTSEKKRLIIGKIIFSLFLCLYIQGNFLNLGYAQLDGTEIVWKDTVAKGIKNTIIWGIIFALPFIIRPLKKEKKFNIISSAVSGFIILIEISTISIMYLSIHSDSLNKDYFLSSNKIFDMSQNENIVLIVADTIEQSYLNKALEDNPEIKKELSDFTVFDNTTGCSLLTYMSFPTILTGENLPIGKNLQDGVDECYENTELYNSLKENGFETELYVDTVLISSEENVDISNRVNSIVEISQNSKIRLYNLLMECVLYKYMPHFLKSNFQINTSDFNRIDDKNLNKFLVDDVKLNKKLLEEKMTVNEENKIFKVIQMNGCHNPYTTTEDIEYAQDSDYLNNFSDEERQQNEVIATLKFLINYINELKTNEIYDNTTIIFCADHGFENRYNPCFMIKNKNIHNDEMIYNNAPISMKDDLVPTILNIASNSKKYGKDIYDYKEGDARTRKVNDYIYSSEFNNYYVESNIIVMTEGQASNKDDYYVGDQIFAKNGELKKEYSFGKKIGLMTSKNNQYVLTEGILSDVAWNTSKGSLLGIKSNIMIKPKKSNSDVNAILKVAEVYNDRQQIIIRVGETTLFDNTYSSNDKDFEIKFKIPKEIWNNENILKFEIQSPNAKSEYLDSGWGQYPLFLSFTLDYIKFYK